jgi:hypothetical protein
MKRNKQFPSVLLYAIPLIVIFTIVLLAYWSGILVSDSMVQWNEAQTGIIDNWHPAYNTIYIMLLTKIWNNPGFVLFVQELIMSFSIAYFMANLEKYYHINRKYLFICTILLGLIPLNYNFAVTLLKDTLYSTLIVLLSAIIIDLVNDKKFTSNGWKLFSLGIVVLFICLFRQNGIYAMVLFSIILALIYKKASWLKVTLFASIVMYTFLTTVGFNILHIAEGNYANKYAPVSHLMARMLNTPNVNFTNQELKELSEFVDVDKLKTTFNPYNMDYSIAAQKTNGLIVNGNKYLKLCLIKIKEYPVIFIKQYLIIDSYLYSPVPFKSDALVVGMFTQTDLWVYKDKYPNLEEHSKLPWLLPKIQFMEKGFQYGKLSYVTLRPAIYIYFSIIALILIARWRKNKTIFLIGLASFLNIVSLAPAMPVAMTRYVYSSILMGYLLLIWFVYELHLKRKVKGVK